jgi:glycosyltransferase involved in cell wall biosynthesis
MNISIIIPAYNEAAGIGDALQSLLDEPRLNEAEIIVINDGSSDDTAEVVAQYERVTLVNHGINRGYGSALRTGIRRAQHEHIFWFDSDGQHRVEDLLNVVDTLIENDLDYCIGVRDQRSHAVLSRSFGKAILRVAVRIAAGTPVQDYNSGLRGFKKDVISKYLHLFPNGFSASTTSTLIMMERGYVGRDVPIIVKPRVGSSSVNQLRDGMRTLTTIMRIFILFKPLLFFGTIGMIFIIVGAGYGFVRYLEVDRGFPTFAALIIILGMQTLILGLLADQISALRRERFQ